jgi:enoyl-CoA hydratase/carnithine racemase/MFS family permease
MWGAASGIGLAAGPVLGGILTAALGWRAIFLVNLPIAAAAAGLVRRHVGETPRHRRPLDVPGQALATAGLAALTGGFIIAGSRGWDGRLTLALLAAGIASAGAFAIVERAAEHPMVDPVLFSQRTFSIAVALGVIFNFCLYGSIFCLAIDLHRAHGLDALKTGLALLPMTIVTGAMAFLSGRLVGHIGEWNAIVVGLTAGAVGALLISLAAGSGLTMLVVSGVPVGVTAVAMPAMTAVAMSHAPRHRIGLAAGVFNASRQTGGALGVAVLGALLVGGSGHVTLRTAFLATAAAYAAGIALALTGRRRTGLLGDVYQSEFKGRGHLGARAARCKARDCHSTHTHGDPQARSSVMPSATKAAQVRLDRVTPSHCRVVLDNPPVNLMGPEFVLQIREIVTELENDDRVKVVVFESAVDGFFLNHSDFLANFEDLTSIPQGPTGLEAWPDVLVRLTRAPFVSIALIRGRATGNGSELALACDMSFASREKALLSQWEVGVGLVAGGGPMARLPRVMGRGRALEVLLSSDDIRGADAEFLGYVNRALADAELDDFVDALATRIASFDKWAIANTKRLVNEASLPPDVEIRAGWDACMASVKRPAAQERIKALLEQGLQEPGDSEDRLGFHVGQLSLNGRR